MGVFCRRKTDCNQQQMLNKELDGVFQMVMGKTPPWPNGNFGRVLGLGCLRTTTNRIELDGGYLVSCPRPLTN